MGSALLLYRTRNICIKQKCTDNVRYRIEGQKSEDTLNLQSRRHAVARGPAAVLAQKYFIPLFITISVSAQPDNFVDDYFMHKNVSRLTIFSCDDLKNDFHLVKKMNALGISVAVAHPNAALYNVSAEILRKDYWPFGLFLDTRCQTREVNKKIVAQTTKHQLYEGIHVWLILGSNLEETLELLNDTMYSVTTDLIIGVKKEIGYELYDVYNPCKIRGGILNVTSFGFWESQKGLIVTLTQDKFLRRSNFHGLKIKAISVVKYQKPGVKIEDHLEDYTRKSEDPISKYGYGILRNVADLFNFTLEIQTIGEWMDLVNGTEVGSMPILSRGEVDIMASPASATLRFAARPYGRILMPGYPYRTFFILRSNVESFKWAELFTPFTLTSWYATAVTAILSMMIISTIQMSEYRGGWLTEFGHALFATLGVMCQQGLTFVPNRLAGRIACLILLLFGILMTNYYGASVVSVRLSQPPDKLNDSLYSLAKSRMTIASEPYRNIDDNLASRSLNEWEVRYFNEKIWKKLSMSRYVSLQDGLRKAGQGGYAYHTSAEVAYPYVDAHWDDRAICDMTEIHVITPRMMAFWERVESPFNEIMKIGLAKIANVGIRMRTIKRWKPQIPFCSPLARSVQSVTFFEIAPAIMMILIAVGWALVICSIENIVYKIQTARSP